MVTCRTVDRLWSSDTTDMALECYQCRTPRGRRAGQEVSEAEIAEHAKLLDVYAWEVEGIENERWTIVSSGQAKGSPLNRTSFDVPGGKPVAGDFNGDGFDELAYFKDGEWFIDLNGNGMWDEGDIWLKMGEKGDQPVIGDWDGDGKDDVGIFGRKWAAMIALWQPSLVCLIQKTDAALSQRMCHLALKKLLKIRA